MRGFTDNLNTIFGYGEMFDDMQNQKIAELVLSDDKEQLTFCFEDGSKVLFGVEGDCCSHSWIEHLEVPNDVKGATVTAVRNSEPVESRDGELKVYTTSFVTDRGDIVLEFRNESNGYYGGYLVRK